MGYTIALSHFSNMPKVKIHSLLHLLPTSSHIQHTPHSWQSRKHGQMFQWTSASHPGVALACAWRWTWRERKYHVMHVCVSQSRYTPECFFAGWNNLLISLCANLSWVSTSWWWRLLSWPFPRVTVKPGNSFVSVTSTICMQVGGIHTPAGMRENSWNPEILLLVHQ